GQRKGLLALVTEPAGDHPALATDASRLVHDVLVQQYYSGQSLSLTSGLLKALDGANGALLEHNYADEPVRPDGGEGQGAPVAVQVSGVRTRRAHVGLTAVLIHPDGQGVYLAQMSPTQAYVVHGGLLSALPEPASWQRPGKLGVVLRRVQEPGAEGVEDEEVTAEAEASMLPPVALPSLPLGSGPDVEVDLLYRRVEAGDLIVVVSSSLARHLEQLRAEEIFSLGDADLIIDALYNLATERGMARSHACVLQLGVEASSGVDTDFTVSIAPPGGESAAANGGARYAPEQAVQDEQHGPALLDVLKHSTRQWFQRRKPATAESIVIEEVGGPPSYFQEEGRVGEEEGPTESDRLSSLHPTEVLLSHSLDVPPYKAQNSRGIGTAEELEFDGWEDVPPALGESRGDEYVWVMRPQPVADNGRWAGPAADKGGGDTGSSTPIAHRPPPIAQEGDDWPVFPVNGAPARAGRAAPQLLDEYEDGEARTVLPIPAPASGARATLQGAGEASRRAGAWVGSVLHGLLPERKGETAAGVGDARQRMIPARVLIAAGVVILLGVLALSLVSMSGSAKKAATNTFLAEAQQEDLLANQLSTPQAERKQHLEKALEKAQQALTADASSTEAARLVQKTQAALDTLQGITRLQPKALFDLDGPSGAEGATTAPQAASEAPANGAAGTGATGSRAGAILVQSNDAYVLDSAKGEVYRCRISARDCAVVLKAGDSAGGQQVGSPLLMTLRVGSLVVVDSNLAAYIFNADSGSWQAEPLGGAEGLDKPRELASYDGNLYLLAAKPGQISKYVPGKYGQPPEDWVKDAASVDQLKDPLAMAIDGSIYVLTPDGKIAVMQGGKIARTLDLKTDAALPPSAQLFTGTDTQDLYAFNPGAGTITRLSKDGQVKATFKGSAGAEPAGSWSAMTVDEGRGKLYLLQGRKVYEASLSTTPAKQEANPIAPPDPTQGSQPLAKPTIAP
ncbi:MAG: hypothetical protein ACJ78Q_03120, partial [Chloroflexia bacterium]